MITGQLPWCYGVSRDPLNVIMLVCIRKRERGEERRGVERRGEEWGEKEGENIMYILYLFIKCMFQNNKYTICTMKGSGV